MAGEERMSLQDNCFIKIIDLCKLACLPLQRTHYYYETTANIANQQYKGKYGGLKCCGLL